MEKIEINYKKTGSCIRLYLNGELDASTCVSADAVFRHAVREDASAIVVDCQELRYISSAGIGVLIALYYSCEQKNRTLLFYGLQPKVRNVLEILGLDKVLHIKNTKAEALQEAASVSH